jgi:hypothetical protein
MSTKKSKWIEENREKWNTYQREFRRRRDPEKTKEYIAKYKLKYPDGYRHAQRKFKYGLTPEDYTQLLVSQQHRCKICNSILEPGRKTCVDHDHITGKVRGILCNSCNLVLGHARDRSEVLEAAIIYLKLTKDEI